MRNGACDPNARADTTDPESVCMHSVQGGCGQSQAGRGSQRSSQAKRVHIWVMELSLLIWCGVCGWSSVPAPVNVWSLAHAKADPFRLCM